MLRLVLRLGVGALSAVEEDFIENQVLLTLNGDAILTQSGLYIIKNRNIKTLSTLSGDVLVTQSGFAIELTG